MRQPEIKLLAITGVTLSENLACFISVNNEPQGFISLSANSSLQASLTLPESGEIYFKIQSLSSGAVLSTCSLDVKDLPLSGKKWVSLLEDSNGHKESEMKIHLETLPQLDLSHVNGRTSPFASESIVNELPSFEVSQEVDRLKSSVDNLKAVKNDLERQVRSYSSLYKEEKYQREQVEAHTLRLTDKLDEAANLKSTRENELLAEIANKDLEIAYMSKENSQLKELNRSLQNELTGLKDKSLFNQTILFNNTQTRLNSLMEKFEESEYQRKILQDKLAFSSGRHVECKVTSPQSLYLQPLPKNRTADEVFMTHLKNKGLEARFKKIARGIYTYDNSKLSVCLKNDNLICRVGGDFMNIDYFLDKYLTRAKQRRLSAEDSPLTKSNTKLRSPTPSEFKTSQLSPISGTVTENKVSFDSFKFKPVLKSNMYTAK